MILRRPAALLLPLLALPLVLSLAACSTLDSIAILPAAGSVVLTGLGQTAQYSAFGQSQMGTGIPTTSNITGSVTWSTTNPSVATINSAGVATAVGAGYTQVLAQSGGQVATSDLTVELPSSGSGSTTTPSITVTPGTATSTFTGETSQFEATGNLTGTGSSQNLNSQVQWISTNVQVATINQSGLATAVGGGTTTIIAQSGGVNGTAVLNVATTVASPTPTLTIIPGAGAASFIGETTQFIALGNLSGGVATQNLTSSVVWSSSDVSVATVDQTGLATAVSANTAPESTTITAIGTTSTGSLISATSVLTVSSVGGTVGLPTLAVYLSGTGTGTVTACIVGSTSSTSCISPATLDCGSPATGASCTETFPLANIVLLTATPASGSVFGGWSSSCTTVLGSPTDPTTGKALECTRVMSDNETVGAIFNP